MKISIEDNFEDVLMKSAVGQRLGHGALAVRSGLSLKEVRALLDGEFDEKNMRKVAAVLSLNADNLVSMAKSDWYPELIAIDSLKCFNTPFPEAGYPGASVNNFLVYDASLSEAIVFDTGMNANALLSFLKARDLRLGALFLTHTHRDHVGAYREILEVTQCSKVFAPSLEPYAEATVIEPGPAFQLGALSVEARQTNGHSRGGMTYVIDGLSRKVAIVGDSIFCLSIGGAKQAYSLAIKNNREQILSLPDDTVLCPGHGPMTTVGEELDHNPFF